MMSQPLAALIQEVATRLQESNRRVVFAESCTGGLVSASLARVPGISEFHCGSAVVYRLDTKTQWLGVPEALLLDPGPVSEVVAREMALGVLARTPEANLSASITGHLGPNAPDAQDGLVFIGIARRSTEPTREPTVVLFEERLPFEGPELHDFPGISVREQRQWLAVERVLSRLKAVLTNPLAP